MQGYLGLKVGRGGLNLRTKKSVQKKAYKKKRTKKSVQKSVVGRGVLICKYGI